MKKYYKIALVLMIYTLISLISLLLYTPSLKAQWMDQTITLKPGWNAVYLEVQPEPDECNIVFQDVPEVESVWTWNRHFSSVQFIKDPETLVPNQPGWLTYLPPEKSNSFLTNLFIIQGGWAYLIKLGGNESVDWKVRGKPVSRSIDWMPNSYNFIGFHVDSTGPPTFASFFAPSPAHGDKPVYRLNSFEQWEIIPATEFIRPGEGYWVYCKGQSKYSGPLSLTPEQGGGLDFGRILTEQTLRVRNETSSQRQITFTSHVSELPPEGISPLLAGDVLLTYWNKDTLGWVDLPNQLQIDIMPGEELALRTGVKRKEMPGAPNAIYQSLLEVSDNQGSLHFLPVTARGLISYEQQALTRSRRYRADEPINMRAGLWVGMATIDNVSCPTSDNPDDPQATGSEFQFRLIVHVDAAGQAKLLQQAILMWKYGTEMEDPDDPTKMIVDEPGRFVILTREDLVSQFSGAAIIDGKPVARRISSAAFTFSDPVSMTGDFDNILICNPITLDYDDPLNPFKHKYHPYHDNLDNEFKQTLPEGKESYTITRKIRLEFTSEAPEGLELSGWGDNQVGGEYRESIEGVHKNILHVKGKFRLHHVSRVPVLNDGL